MSLAEVQARIAAIEARINAMPSLQSAKYMPGTTFAAALEGALGEGDSASGSYRSSSSSGVRTPEGVIAAATKYIGVPYVWGGTDPDSGLDCSGLVQQVYADLGIDLPRVSSDQARVGMPVASLADAQPGDLVAFNTPVDHIGIYAGDGKMIVAPKRGENVQVQDITMTPVAIRRVLGSSLDRPAAVDGATSYQALFDAAGSRYGVPSQLLAAVASAESGFNPSAVSPAGARGLMQLMPSTAKALGVDPGIPAEAVDGAARLLRGHLDRFGSVDLALAAYNAGGNAVARYGGIPPYAETQKYVQRVMSRAGGSVSGAGRSIAGETTR